MLDFLERFLLGAGNKVRAEDEGLQFIQQKLSMKPQGAFEGCRAMIPHPGASSPPGPDPEGCGLDLIHVCKKIWNILPKGTQQMFVE